MCWRLKCYNIFLLFIHSVLLQVHACVLGIFSTQFKCLLFFSLFLSILFFECNYMGFICLCWLSIGRNEVLLFYGFVFFQTFLFHNFFVFLFFFWLLNSLNMRVTFFPIICCSYCFDYNFVVIVAFIYSKYCCCCTICTQVFMYAYVCLYRFFFSICLFPILDRVRIIMTMIRLGIFFVCLV